MGWKRGGNDEQEDKKKGEKRKEEKDKVKKEKEIRNFFLLDK